MPCRILDRQHVSSRGPDPLLRADRKDWLRLDHALRQKREGGDGCAGYPCQPDQTAEALVERVVLRDPVQSVQFPEVLHEFKPWALEKSARDFAVVVHGNLVMMRPLCGGFDLCTDAAVGHSRHFLRASRPVLSHGD